MTTPATRLQVLQATGDLLGFVREIQTTPGDFDCPVHATPILEHRLETIGGWQAVQACPAFDGTCPYDPDRQPTQTEPPETEDDKRVDSHEARTTGGF